MKRTRMPVLIAGPCVIETRQRTLSIASHLVTTARRHRMRLIFKASFDKANRTALSSFRGPGMDQGLAILAEVRRRFGMQVMTDIHEPGQAAPAAQVVDILQIPAFLCRQTDVITAAAATGRALNIKKGQFMAPWDMRHVVAKARAAGARDIWLTERGSCFGYNRLVVDMTSLEYMKQLGCSIVFDVTHSLQLPGGLGSATGSAGSEYAAALARAAAGVGVDAFFIEVHPRPARALSDAATSLDYRALERLLRDIRTIR